MLELHPQWDSFFLGEAGAAAALTGLLFVAVSINLGEIVKDPVLPGRAGETIAMLAGSLIGASLMLLPDQPDHLLGAELLVVGLIVWVVPVRSQVVARHADSPSRNTFVSRVVLAQIATLPAILAGVLLVLGAPIGVAFLAFGILATFTVAILNAWVLLVEIVR